MNGSRISLALLLLACSCTVVSLVARDAPSTRDTWKQGHAMLECISCGTTYYISSSTGNDSNDGLSPGTAWKTFDNVNANVSITYLVQAVDKNGNPATYDNGTAVYTWVESISNGSTTLQPGDTISLQRGDTWHQTLRLPVKGNRTCPISITAHGTGPNPVISLNGNEWEKCVVLDEASFWNISNLSLRSAKIGLYIRYWDTYGNQNVTVTGCDFQDISSPEWERTWEHNFEYSWSTGIFIGGKVFSEQNSTVLENISINNCSFTNCSNGFLNNWYWADPTFRSRLRNLVLENCTLACGGTGFAINTVDGGRATGFRVLDGGGHYSCGTAGGFAQDCQHFVIERCIFGNIKRDRVPDGVGFDFEGNNRNMTFRRNVLCNNDGAGILVMSTNGPNAGIHIEHCLFYNNSRNPSGNDYAFEMLCYDINTNGTLKNVLVFKGNDMNRVTGMLGRTIDREGSQPEQYSTKYLGQYRRDGRTNWLNFQDACQVDCKDMDPGFDYTTLWPVDGCSWCIDKQCPPGVDQYLVVLLLVNVATIVAISVLVLLRKAMKRHRP